MRRFLVPLLCATAAGGALVVPVPASCASGGGAHACVAAIAAAAAQCAAQGAPCTVQLEAGVYPLGGAPYANPLISIAGARDLAVRGAGAALTTLVLHDIAGTFSIADSANVSLGDFSVDSARPYYTLGTVLASSAPGVANLSFDARQYPADTAAFPWLLKAQAAIGYDAANDWFLKDGVDDYWLDAPKDVTFVSTDGATALLSVAGASLPVGQAVVLRHQVYAYNFVSAYNSDAVAVLNVTLFSTPGMGVFTTNCSGVTLDGLEVRKRPGRPMSITADGVHLSNSRGGADLIRRCVFEGQGDDGINIPTIYQDIGAISADRLTLTLGKDGVAGVNSGTLWAGATVNFFGRLTLNPAAPPGRIVSVSGVNVTLAAPLDAAVKLYDLVNNAASYASYVEVSDCTFRANRARGALLKASNLLAARNTFDHCTGSAIKTESDGCYWFEGHPVRNWSIVNNTIRGVNYATAKMPGDIMLDSYVPVFDGHGVPTTQCVTPTTAPVHHGITITGNTFFEDAGSSAVAMFSAETILIAGNAVTRAAGTPVPAFDFGCGSGSCANSTAAGNSCNGNGGACVVSGL